MQTTHEGQTWRAWVTDQKQRDVMPKIKRFFENTSSRGPYPLYHMSRPKTAKNKLIDPEEHILHPNDFLQDGVLRPIRVRIILDGRDTGRDTQVVPKAGSLERWDVVQLVDEFMPEVRGFVALIEPIHHRWSLPQIPGVKRRKLLVRALIKDFTTEQWLLWCDQP